MIGIDTNVLLRFLFADDPTQSPKARALIEQHGSRVGSVRLGDVVLVEACWVLKRIYRFDRAQIVKVIDQLLGNPAFAFSDRERVLHALDDCRRAPYEFADCLIARNNGDAGCDFTATLDRKMRGFARVKLL